MAVAKQGDRVKVHYTGSLADGTVFDSSQGRDPLEFVVGQHQVIAGFEDAVEGMNVGESTETTIPADQAYGQRRDDLMLTVPRAQMPPNMEPQVGMQLQLRQPNGRPAIARITAVTDDAVTLDVNHPLAGQDLSFTIELVEIVG
jgi:peptidylprolyl isomerase